MLDEEYRDWQRDNEKQFKPQSNGAAKRTKAEPTSAGGAKAKKLKQEGDEEGVTDADMREAYAKDSLSTFKVANLKGWLQVKGQKHTGKKADLIDAVVAFFETNT